MSLDISAKVDGVPQLSQPVSLKLTGPFESRGQNKVPKLDWDVNVSGAGQTFTGSIISTGDNAFVGFQGQNYEVGTEAVKQFEQQAAQQQQQQGLTPAQLGIDPASWVKDAKEDGEEDVAGTKTTKITGGLDIEKMLNDLNGAIDKAGPAMGQNAQKLTPEQINQVKQVVKDPTFEAFVAEDKTLRRLSRDDQLHDPRGAAPAGQRRHRRQREVLDPVRERRPARAGRGARPTRRPLSELQQQIQSGGLGGIGGSGSQDPGSGGSGGSGSGSGGLAARAARSPRPARTSRSTRSASRTLRATRRRSRSAPSSCSSRHA